MIKVNGNKLCQWNLNRTVELIPQSGETLEEVRFTKFDAAEPLVTPHRNENGSFVADIPNILLKGFGVLTVEMITVNDIGDFKSEKACFTVHKADKPGDYVYVETETVTGGGTGGGGGATSWDDLGIKGYQGNAVVVPQQHLDINENLGGCLIPGEVIFVVGKEYEVLYSNSKGGTFTSYKCIAEELVIEGMRQGVALGNTSVVGGSTVSEAPFIILCDMPVEDTLPGYGGMLMALDGATSVSFYINGPVPIIDPIPPRYLSNTPLVVHFTGTTADDLTVKEYFSDVYQAACSEIRPVVAFISSGEGVALVYNLSLISQTNLTFTRIGFSGNTVNAYELTWFNDGSIELKSGTSNITQ